MQTRHPAWRDINWTPLLIVISSAYLISLATYAVVGYAHSDLELDLAVVLSFLASAALMATIALVIFGREDVAKRWLIVGMVLLLCMLALRVWIYLRA